MARRPTQQAPKGPAQLTSDQLSVGIDRLQKVVEKIRQFDPLSVTEQYEIPHVEALSAAIDDALVRTFGPDTLDYDRYKYASEFDNGPHNYAFQVNIGEVHRSLARSKERNIAVLGQAIEGLQERLSELRGSTASAVKPRATENSTKVFVVHGHLGEPREAVARFLQRLGLEPIILHEQANQGRTIIEKFEAHADVGFAVILLTPDDVGGAQGGAQNPRARQNVVLELGYFIGRLTRARVCALKVGELELPSDILGVVWTPFDGGWKQGLAKELEAAGYAVDWNTVMRG